MPLPPQIDEQIRSRFDTLITEARRLTSVDYRLLLVDQAQASSYTASFYSLRTSTLSLLQLLATKGNHIRQVAENVRRIDDQEVSALLGVLVGLRSDYEFGMLQSLSEMVEASVTADYLEQAEGLLGANRTGQYSYVPAAVLLGAILEDTLRRLCQRQTPPISVTKPGGSHKMLGALIADLKSQNVFNELKAKQLLSWADIRNAAAHGRFDHFTRSDVEQMLRGVQNFLADYL